MTPDAELTVRLLCAEQKVAAVGVASSRNGLPPALVRDRAPSEVAALMPRLFSICSRAQGAAAAAALDAAQGVAAADRVALRRLSVDVALEALQETLWRLLIDWPEAMNEAPLLAPVREVRHALAAFDPAPGAELPVVIAEVAARDVFGQPPADWCARDPASLMHWIDEGATLPARLLRRLLAEAPGLGLSSIAPMPLASIEALETAILPRLLHDAAFPKAPLWDGLPVETGALARQVGHPLLAEFVSANGRTAAARFLARLVELAQLIDPLPVGSPMAAAVRGHAMSDGSGIGLAETARGLLLHRARVDGARVVDYQIVAPTDWNFHPQGGLRSLAGRSADDRERLASEARLVVRSLDPCVACRVEIEDA
jgi:hypothetical protein